MKLFIDVDNTILEHSSFYSLATEGRVHSTIGRYPIENAKSIKTMYESAICRNPDLVKELFQLDDVYILTKYPAIEYEHHKQRRVAEILGYDHETMMQLKDKKGHPKYIYLDVNDSKVSVVKKIFGLDSLEDCILIDDYSNNLMEWENHDGIAIKYFNEYNSPNHPTSGLSISNFKLFKFMLTHKPIQSLLVAATNAYKLHLFLSHVRVKEAQSIDLLKSIYLNAINNLQLEHLKVDTKYDVNNFILEYYRFQENINPNYWASIFKPLIDYSKFNLIYSLFHIDYKKLNLINHSNQLTLCLLGSQKPPVVYDVYFTYKKHLFMDEIETEAERLMSIFALLTQ